MNSYRFDAPEENAPPPMAASASIAYNGSDADEAARLRRAIGDHVTELLGEEDSEFVQDLVTTFCEAAHGLIANARSAANANDLNTAAGVAHQLKGSAANIGLTEIQEAWNRVETGARAGDPTVLGLALANAAEMTERAAHLLEGSA